MGLRQQVNIDLAKNIYQRFLLSNVAGSQSPRNNSATENSAEELLAVRNSDCETLQGKNLDRFTGTGQMLSGQ